MALTPMPTTIYGGFSGMPDRAAIAAAPGTTWIDPYVPVYGPNGELQGMGGGGFVNPGMGIFWGGDMPGYSSGYHGDPGGIQWGLTHGMAGQIDPSFGGTWHPGPGHGGGSGKYPGGLPALGGGFRGGPPGLPGFNQGDLPGFGQNTIQPYPMPTIGWHGVPPRAQSPHFGPWPLPGFDTGRALFHFNALQRLRALQPA